MNTLQDLTVEQRVQWIDTQIRILAQGALDLDIQETFLSMIHRLLAQAMNYEPNPFHTKNPQFQFREWDEMVLMENLSPMAILLYSTMTNAWSTLRPLLFTPQGTPILHREEIRTLVRFLTEDEPCMLNSAMRARWRERTNRLIQMEEDRIVLIKDLFQKFRNLFQTTNFHRLEFDLLDEIFRPSRISWTALENHLVRQYTSFAEDQKDTYYAMGQVLADLYNGTRTHNGYPRWSSYQMEQALRELPSYRNCFLESEENE